eukprot:5301870-Lingulodinium_polyedra.AAC.1
MTPGGRRNARLAQQRPRGTRVNAPEGVNPGLPHAPALDEQRPLPLPDASPSQVPTDARQQPVAQLRDDHLRRI